MLKVLRENLRYLSWVLWLVIIVFVGLAFVEFGTVGPGAESPQAAAASVGGDEVTYAEFQRQYQAVEQQYRQALGDQFTEETVRQLRLPIQVLDQLINQKILLREAERVGLVVSDEDVRAAILDLPGFRDERGRFVGEELYSQVLRSYGYSPSAFEDEIRQQLLLERLMEIFRRSLHIDSTELERAHREDVERARIRYVQLSPQALRGEIEVDADSLAAYFEENREAYRLPEKRVVDYLLVETSAVRQGLELDDPTLEEYYRQNPQEFTREEEVRARHILVGVDEERPEPEARELIEEVRSRIEAGEDFAALAREVSEDPGSRDRGGDLGFFGRGRMLREFEEAAFAAEPGELVGPVRTGFGFHLLEVLERREGGLQPFEEVRGRIESRLRSERAAELTEETARRLARQLLQEEGSGAEALAALADTEPVARFATTPAFGADEAVPGIGRETPFSVRAFELAEGQISEPVRIPRGWAILHLSEVQAPRLPELSEVEADVRRDFLEARAEELAHDRLAELREGLDAGGDLDELAAGLGLSPQESERFGPQGVVSGLGVNRALSRLALGLEEGEFGGPVEARGGPVVFEVTERRHFDPAEFAREKDALRARLEEEKVNRLLGSLIQKRREELRVRYDSRLLESFELDEPA